MGHGTSREEVRLLNQMLTDLPGMEPEIIATGGCVLLTPPTRKREVALLAVTDEALVYYLNYETGLFTWEWNEIVAVTDERKRIRHRMTIDLVDGSALKFRIDSPRIANAIRDAWSADREQR